MKEVTSNINDVILLIMLIFIEINSNSNDDKSNK